MVVDVGVHCDGLHVVRSGAVDIVDEAGGLIERIGAGGAFGMTSLLEHRPTRYRSVAVEDTLLIVLPAETFEELSRDHTGSRRSTPGPTTRGCPARSATCSRPRRAAPC